jgi:PIN domain nuclease of toxin-antitoxin system
LIVLDASALLTVVKKERGADIVESTFGDAAISVVNVTEVISKVWDWNLDADTYVRNLAALPLEFVDFTFARAAQAGHLRSATRNLGLSLGDRACIALAIERDCPVLTADRSWAKLNIGVPIRLIR